MLFHWSSSYTKCLQVSRTLPCILAMLLFGWSWFVLWFPALPVPFPKPLGIVPSEQIIIGITVIFKFHNILVLRQGISTCLSFHFLRSRSSCMKFCPFVAWNLCTFVILPISIFQFLSFSLRSIVVNALTGCCDKSFLFFKRLIGLVGGVFANGLGGLGSIPGRVIPKIFKMVVDTSLPNTQQYKVRINCKVESMQGKKRHPPLHLGVVAIEKRAFGSPSTTVAN